MIESKIIHHITYLNEVGHRDDRPARSEPARPALGERLRGAGSEAHAALDALVTAQLEARAAARAARDYATADAIRDQLSAVGILIEDTASGANWSLVRRTDS